MTISTTQLNDWRAKAQANQLSIDEAKQIIVLLREHRQAAAVSGSIKAAKSKVAATPLTMAQLEDLI